MEDDLVGFVTSIKKTLCESCGNWECYYSRKVNAHMIDHNECVTYLELSRTSKACNSPEEAIVDAYGKVLRWKQRR